MPIVLTEPKRVAVEKLDAGHPLRELPLSLPDRIDSTQFDSLVPLFISFALGRLLED